MKNVIMLMLFVCACSANNHIKMVAGEPCNPSYDASIDSIDSDAGECGDMLGSSLEWTLIKEGSSKKCYPNAVISTFNDIAGTFDKLTSQDCKIAESKLDPILCNIHYDVMCKGMNLFMDCDTNTSKCTARADIAVLYNAQINGDITTCNFEVKIK